MSPPTDRGSDLGRIRAALGEARLALRSLSNVDLGLKGEGDPVTEADLAVDAVLRRCLLREGEGWLSEETRDDPGRLGRRRVWIVDPIDGTREFVEGIPEWSVSIGLVEDGRPVAGGILNPATGEAIVGAVGSGVTLNDAPVRLRNRGRLEGATILASRSEFRRGEWDCHKTAPFRALPVGSVAWKLACVASGKADGTWTEKPRNEWDLAGGVALVLAAGGTCRLPDGCEPLFNRPDTLLPGLFAGPEGLIEDARAYCAAGKRTG